MKNRTQKLKPALAIVGVLLLAQIPFAYLVLSGTAQPAVKVKEITSAPPLENVVFSTSLLSSEFIPKQQIQSLKHTTKVSEPDRMFQAKELLGKYYGKSIVKTGEKVAGIESYIYNYVKSNLDKPWRKKGKAIAKEIIAQGNKWNLDPIFILSMIENESKFNINAVGGVGEIGLMQVRPETAEWIAKQYKLKWHGKNDLFDPVKNIRIGTAYVSYLREKHDFHSRLYLSAYNMGSTNVHRALAKQIWPKDYASKVMQFYIKNYSNLSTPAEFLNQEGAFRAPTTAHHME